MRRILIAFMALAIAAGAAAQQTGPFDVNFRVRLDGSSEGTGPDPTTPPVSDPNTEDDSIVVTINGPTNGVVNTPFAMTSSAAGAGAKTWSLAPNSGQLPPGLSLDPGTGGITGSTDVAGLSPVLFTRATRTSDGRFGNSPPFRLNFLTAAQNATATYAGASSATVGAAYAGSSSSTGLTSPVGWTLGSGALPAGLTLNGSTGQISGVPAQVETRTGISLIARGANGVAAATQTFQISVAEAPSGALALVMPDVTTYVGQFVSRRAVAYGGTPMLTTSHVSALPDGLSSNGPTVSGVPTTAGTFTGLVAVANDAGGATAQATYTVTVLPAQATTISISSRTVTVGEAVSIFPSVANATLPASYEKSQGNLPAGLAIDPNSGAITGVPTATGTHPGIVVTITDAIGRTASTSPFAITVAPAAPLKATVASTTLTYNVAKSIPIAVSGSKQGPYSYALASGTLPTGLAVNQDGTISGATTRIGLADNLSVRVTSADGTEATSNTFYLNVTGSGTIEVVMPEEIYPGTVGKEYANAFSVRGLSGTGPVTGPVTWRFVTSSNAETTHAALTGAGMTLDTTAGAITGSPTQSFDVSNIRLQATDAAGRTGASQAFRLAAKPDFSVAWQTDYTAPPEKAKRNAYFSTWAKVLADDNTYFTSWSYRKRGNVSRLWEQAGDPMPGISVSQGGSLSGYANFFGPKTYALQLTDARGLKRKTPNFTTDFLDTSYIESFDPVTMSECGSAGVDNMYFGGTWTSVNGKAVWTGRQNTTYSTHTPPRPWPSPASLGQGFDFYAKVEPTGPTGGHISVRVDQYRYLEGKINASNLLVPSDNGWFYVNQTSAGNMPAVNGSSRAGFGTYGNLRATFNVAGTFTETIVFQDWRTGVNVPYTVEYVVRPRDPPICGFVVN